jgi:hypothetical protein
MRLPASHSICLAVALAAVVYLAEPAMVSATGIVEPAPMAPEATTNAQAGAAKTPEAHAARAYDEAVHSGPLAVQAFLAEFPKGADLHFHLGAGVYA